MNAFFETTNGFNFQIIEPLIESRGVRLTWFDCKNNQAIWLYLADFALQEQPEDNLVVAISRAWYNGSYAMAAKAIKSLELHYIMIKFLII